MMELGHSAAVECTPAHCLAGLQHEALKTCCERHETIPFGLRIALQIKSQSLGVVASDV